MAKKTNSKYSAADAYAAMGQDPAAMAAPDAGAPAPAPGDTGGDDQGQPLTIPPDVVAQLVQLKQSGDMAGLGQAIAQLLP